MSITNVILAVEDELSESISRQILRHFNFEIQHTIRGKGNVFLRQKAPELNRSANRTSIFLLTDLDTPRDCPLGLIRSWIKGPINPTFFFRVAVMEVESWVMADRMGFAAFLSIPLHRIPSPTDDILNPKEFLLSLARRSKKKSVREALLPAQGSTLSVGNEYNTLLSEFVQEHWNIERAAAVSPSLKRTLDRLSRETRIGSNR
ncbi:hypothetical protein F4Y59_13770 [Candidatus Poribacteria bacterium]|nr:hypothetical protein [Candidatus Poribacteria bacterium]MYK20116.1 hypothetical protein [Candidatus Poribacteria bacterium]